LVRTPCIIEPLDMLGPDSSANEIRDEAGKRAAPPFLIYLLTELWYETTFYDDFSDKSE
jgi:hypothetical protein